MCVYVRVCIRESSMLGADTMKQNWKYNSLQSDKASSFRKMSVLGITLNCIRWSGPSSPRFGEFIVPLSLPLLPGPHRLVWVSSMGLIDSLKDHLHSIGLCANPPPQKKKTLKKQLHKNTNMSV